MSLSDGNNIANGIISGVVLLCGIIFSILISNLVKKAFSGMSLGSDFDDYLSYSTAPIWGLGFGYIIPGLIGVIASAVAQKGGYITQMVFGILSLLMMGIIFVGSLLVMTTMSFFTSYDGCQSLGSTCFCPYGSHPSLSLGLSCADLKSVNSMAIGACAMIVIGWIAALVTTVLAGNLACSGERVAPGVIIQPQPAVTVMQMGQVGQPNQGGYPVPPYEAQTSAYTTHQQPYPVGVKQ